MSRRPCKPLLLGAERDRSARRAGRFRQQASFCCSRAELRRSGSAAAVQRDELRLPRLARSALRRSSLCGGWPAFPARSFSAQLRVLLLLSIVASLLASVRQIAVAPVAASSSSDATYRCSASVAFLAQSASADRSPWPACPSPAGGRADRRRFATAFSSVHCTRFVSRLFSSARSFASLFVQRLALLSATVPARSTSASRCAARLCRTPCT